LIPDAVIAKRNLIYVIASVSPTGIINIYRPITIIGVGLFKFTKMG
jgi:hypothetical protein